MIAGPILLVILYLGFTDRIQLSSFSVYGLIIAMLCTPILFQCFVTTICIWFTYLHNQ